MISTKKTREKQVKIDIQGNNLENIEELIALIDSVSMVVFKDDDRARREFIKDIPYLIFGAQPTISRMELPCHPEDLKKMLGGEKE